MLPGMASGGWGVHYLQPRRRLFQPQPAAVRQEQLQYPNASLLGLALEIRAQIWEDVHNKIEAQRASLWSSKPKTEFDALPLVCRQIHAEIQDYLYRSIVPTHQLPRFLNQSYSISKFRGLSSLSVEIPFNVSTAFVSAMVNVLDTLSLQLESLQLFFTGSDLYGNRVWLHGCGNRLATAASRDVKLPQDGQNFEIWHPLINALATLPNLRHLTLSNLNIPLLQTHVIKSKPRLQKLCIVSDPRSTLHFPWRGRSRGAGLLIPVTHNFPPVKELYLNANAVVGAVQIPGKLSVTLEKLTWVVPNVARQAGSMAPHWHEETGIILMNLRNNSKCLHTLRICMEGSFHEAHVSHGALIGAFKQYVPNIDSLKHLELHLWSKSPYTAQEFISALPPSLETFSISDRFVSATELLQRIKRRYAPHLLAQDDHSKVLNDQSDDGQSDDGESDHGQSNDSLAEVQPSIEAKRRDYIPVDARLEFVNYEYDDRHGGRSRVIMAPLLTTQTRKSLEASRSTSIVDDTGLALMLLNARLQDRALNSHLPNFKKGIHIPPLLYVHESRPVNIGQLRSFVDMGLHDVPLLNQQSPEIIPEYDLSTAEFHFQNKSYDAYFGHEDEAAHVFAFERVRRVENVVPRRCPIVVSCPTGYEDHEHWMCN